MSEGPKDEIFTHREENVEPDEKGRQNAECREFIEANKKSVADALSELIEEYQIVLLGEHHGPEGQSIRSQLVGSLERLKEEGLTLLALEIDADKQEAIDALDDDDPDFRQKVKEAKITKIPSVEDYFADILFEAKRIGLEIVLIDAFNEVVKKIGRRDSLRLDNVRDRKMFDNLNKRLEGLVEEKVLVLIGSRHVPKRIVEKRRKSGKRNRKIPIKRFGTHLAENYGSENIASIRYLSHEDQFDALPGPRWAKPLSKTPSPKDLYETSNEAIVLPDGGPVKGDENVTASDYLVVNV